MSSSESVLPRLLEARASGSTADRPFVRHEGVWSSFAEVFERATGWARRLTTLGVERGDRVATLLPTSTHTFETWAGIGWLHAIEVPVHTELRGAMLAHVLNDSGAVVLVATERFLDQVEQVSDDLEHLEKVIVIAENLGEPEPRDLGPRISCWNADEIDLGGLPSLDAPKAWDHATIIYTSGTTGPAKGVMLPWGQFHAGLTGLFPDVGGDDCFYVPLPLHHIAGRGMVYRALETAGRAALRERFSLSHYWDDVAASDCTTTIMMGTIAELLWREPPSPDDAENPLERVLMSPLIPDAAEFADRFGVRLRTNFGMTELGAPIIGGVDAPLPNLTSCGRPRAGYHCRIVDEHDFEVPVGEIGELVVRTDQPWSIMLGYWNAPTKTNEAMRNQWFHTGDAFRTDEDGNMYFVDRRKDVIRRSGENVSSFHLEHEIADHPSVAECAVVGVESEFGDEEIRVFLVPAEGSDIDFAHVCAHTQQRVARFMVPRFWTAVTELPKTQTLRVRKTELRDRPLGADTWDRMEHRSELSEGGRR